MKKRLLAFLIFLFVAFTAIGCSPSEATFSLKLESERPTVAVGESVVVTATFANEGALAYYLNYSSDFMWIQLDTESLNFNVPYMEGTLFPFQNYSLEREFTFDAAGTYNVEAHMHFHVNETDYTYFQTIQIVVEEAS